MNSMKFSLIVLAAIFTCGHGSAVGQVVTPEQKRAAGELMATLALWADAVRDRNTNTLDEILAEDVVITTFDGKVRGKKVELEAMRPNPAVRTTHVANEDVSLKIFGEVAVVTALTRMDFVANEKDSSIALRYTAVFVKRDGRWQIVALQTARL
jgi:ketosteroid isomerase-like protein